MVNPEVVYYVIAMLDLTGHMIIWGELFAHGDGSTGLMKVVFVTPYRRSCTGLATTKHFISGQPHFGSCLATSQAMKLSEQPLAVKNVVQFGLYVA
jgi:hypothetical protein